MSKGEDKIIKILQDAKIKFEREKTFPDLKNGRFRFDFYLTNLNILIEFDGEPHFRQVKVFQKQRKDFAKYQEHDRIKNSYCLSNNIPLYRVPYWELDSINSIADLFQYKFLVRSKWHNDLLNKRLPGE